jgi:signal transduction histidine kinase
MRSSLFFKLLGAFALVILALAVIVTVLVNRATAGQFRLYSDRNGQLWAAQLAPQLADYFAQRGSWQGSEAVLGGSGRMTGSGMGMIGSGGMGMNGSGVAGASDMPAMMGLRVVLADTRGQVISDSADLLTGQTLPAAELATGTPIQVNGQTVGTLIGASLAAPVAASPAGAFLKDVNRSILLAVLAAGVIALALGALLFFHLTAPIRRLTAAAHAISAGDLSQRVAMRSRDELGELAGAFNKMAENLAAVEGQRRQMVADVAHELRTPLSVIQANVEAMQDGILPTDAEQLASLHEETLLLNRLVADLRLLSLAEAGQLKLELTESDLGELVSRAAERLRPTAEAKGVALVVEVTPDLPRVRVDADRFTQMIGNLVDNALCYTPALGRIVLAVGWRARSGKTRTPTVTVTDTGSGIAPADLPHVFDRFYRGDKSRARASGGSGLGLAIVRQLAESHQGKVWAESPVFHAPDGSGFGTRIVVIF